MTKYDVNVTVDADSKTEAEGKVNALLDNAALINGIANVVCRGLLGVGVIFLTAWAKTLPGPKPTSRHKWKRLRDRRRETI